VNTATTALPLTLESRQALARHASVQEGAARLLAEHPLLEDALAAMADQGFHDDLFRLIARMLPAPAAIFWMVSGHDRMDGVPDPANTALHEARAALLAFAHEPKKENHAQAVTRARALKATTPLGQAGSALALIPAPGTAAGKPALEEVFADLMGRAVWLLCQRGPDERERLRLTKHMAGGGIFLAVNGMPKGWGEVR